MQATNNHVMLSAERDREAKDERERSFPISQPRLLLSILFAFLHSHFFAEGIKPIARICIPLLLCHSEIVGWR